MLPSSVLRLGTFFLWFILCFYFQSLFLLSVLVSFFVSFSGVLSLSLSLSISVSSHFIRFECFFSSHQERGSGWGFLSKFLLSKFLLSKFFLSFCQSDFLSFLVSARVSFFPARHRFAEAPRRALGGGRARNQPGIRSTRRERVLLGLENSNSQVPRRGSVCFLACSP